MSVSSIDGCATPGNNRLSTIVSIRAGSLIVWDVRSGEPTREVKLDCANTQLCPKMLLPAAGSVICDYGSELRIVRFPLVADKSE